MNVPKPIYKVKYKGSDITEHVTSLSYTDKVHGESDELTLTVEDSDGRWQNSWYPTKGDKLTATIGSTDCGTFEIDEITLSGPGDSITVKGIASGITKAMRTKDTVAHEKKKLKEVVEFTAKKIGCRVDGEFDDNPQLERVTQHRENGLSFMNRIGNEYGYVVALRNDTVTFTKREKLEQKEHITVIGKSDISSYSFSDKTQEVYKKAKSTYHNPANREVVEHTADSTTSIDGTSDTLMVYTKSENKQQAEIKAKSQLYKANTQNKKGSVTLSGNERLVAGINIKIEGFGKFSGKYHIESSTHKIDKGGGHITSLELKGV
jgi:phage protein D